MEQICGIETEDELFWIGEEAESITWDTRTIPIDDRGSTATVSGYEVIMSDGTTRFLSAHKIVRIFRAAVRQGPFRR